MTRPIVVAAAVLMLALTIASPAPGTAGTSRAETVGGDIRLSGNGAVGDDVAPAVAANDTNREYLVVWSDARHGAGHYDIYARRLSVDGEKMGPDFRISGDGATGNEVTPAVTWNATRNEYLVVWADDRYNGLFVGQEIYGRVLSGDGSPKWDDFQISDVGVPGQTAGQEYSPSVAWNPVADQYFVVWRSGRDFADRGWEIYGERVAAIGFGGVGHAIQISGANAVADEYEPDVTSNSTTGEYLVVWEDGRNYAAGSGYDVYGRRISTTGAKLGGDFRVNRGSTGDQASPAAVWNEGAGQYLVVWMDGRAYGTNREDVYGRRLGADGSRQGGDIRIASAGNTATDQNHPDVASNSNTGGYLIVWTDWRNSHSGAVDDRGSDTYARRLNADGSRSGGEFRVASGNATANEDDPAVAFERGLYGGYLPVWSDARWAATAAQEIVGRLVVP